MSLIYLYQKLVAVKETWGFKHLPAAHRSRLTLRLWTSHLVSEMIDSWTSSTRDGVGGVVTADR